jgi:hypothetical protein
MLQPYKITIEKPWHDNGSHLDVVIQEFLQKTTNNKQSVLVEITYQPLIDMKWTGISRLRSLFLKIKVCAPRISSCTVLLHPDTNPKLVKRMNKWIQLCQPSFPILLTPLPRNIQKDGEEN